MTRIVRAVRAVLNAHQSFTVRKRPFSRLRRLVEEDVLRQTDMPSSRILSKTAIACVIVVGTNVLGNYALARGMQSVAIDSLSPIAYIRALLHPWTASGTVFMIAWFISRLALLSWADLSYVMPISASAYLLSAILGVLVLRESVSPIHWAGILFITFGVVLVALTQPETDGRWETKP
jgi:uncharacterized membrane protein